MLPSRTTLAPLLALGLLAVAAPAYAQMQPIPGSTTAPPAGTFARPAAPSPWDRAPGSSPWDRAPGGSAAAPAPAPMAAPAGPSAFDRPAQAMGEPPCLKDFLPLREDAEKKAMAVQNASKRKPSPQEACRLFTSLVAAQDKLSKFIVANAKSCGIPAEAATQIKTAHTQTDDIRVRVCEAAARPAAPRGPSLSDALGTSQSANPTNVRRGGGTFDTLSGNVLAR